MEIIIKVCAIAIFGSIAVLTVRRILPEMALSVSIILLVFVFLFALGAIERVISFIFVLSENAGLDKELTTPLVKVLGISIVTKLATDICREAGVLAVASCIELLGGCIAIVLAFPLMMSLLSQITV